MFKSEVFKSISLLSSGTVLAQIIPLLFAPFIGRLFNAQQFGEFAAVLAIVNILSVILNGRYELAIVLPKNNSDAQYLMAGAWIISACVAILFFFISIPFHGLISSYFDVEFGFFESIIIALLLICVGFWQPINYYFIRNKEYLKMTYNKFVKSIATVVVTITVGYFLSNSLVNGLVIGLIMGWLLLALFSFYQMGFFQKKTPFPLFNSSILLNLKKYLNYPKHNAFPALLNSIGSQLGFYLFLYLYSTEMSGFYSFSKQYLYVPLSILGVSLSQVYFQRISEKFNNKQSVQRELRLLFLFLFSLGVLVCAIIIPFSEELFSLFFGDQWLVSAQMSKLLIIVFAIQFMVSPLSTVLYALNKVKWASVFPVVYFLFMASLLALKGQPVDTFLRYYVFAEAIPYLFYFTLICLAVRQYEQRLTNDSAN